MPVYLNGHKYTGAYMNGHRVNGYFNGTKLFNYTTTINVDLQERNPPQYDDDVFYLQNPDGQSVTLNNVPLNITNASQLLRYGLGDSIPDSYELPDNSYNTGLNITPNCTLHLDIEPMRINVPCYFSENDSSIGTQTLSNVPADIYRAKSLLHYGLSVPKYHELKDDAHNNSLFIYESNPDYDFQVKIDTQVLHINLTVNQYIDSANEYNSNDFNFTPGQVMSTQNIKVPISCNDSGDLYSLYNLQTPNDGHDWGLQHTVYFNLYKLSQTETHPTLNIAIIPLN